MSNLSGFTELELMIGNMYGEARLVEGDLSDDIREYLAIGCVVMNRVKSSGFPSTIKGVILAPKQFSWTNAGDPSRDKVIAFLSTKQPSETYQRLKTYAQAIIDGNAEDFSKGADHYVARWLYEREKKQAWINKMKITAIYGGHVFLKS